MRIALLGLLSVASHCITAAEPTPFDDAAFTIEMQCGDQSGAPTTLVFKDGQVTDAMGKTAKVSYSAENGAWLFSFEISDVSRFERGLGDKIIDKLLSSMSGSSVSASAGPADGTLVTTSYSGTATADTLSGSVTCKYGKVDAGNVWKLSGKRIGPAHEVPPYKEPVNWGFSVKSVNGAATLDMDGAVVIFAAVKDFSGQSSGGITIAGSGSSKSRAGDLYDSYQDGVTTINFHGNTLIIRNEGKVLSVNGKEFQLAEGRPTIVVEANGSIVQKALTKHGPKLALDGREFLIDISSALGDAHDRLRFEAGSLHCRTMESLVPTRTPYQVAKKGDQFEFTCEADGEYLDPVHYSMSGKVDGEKVSGKGKVMSKGKVVVEFTFMGSAKP